jgi:general L-amino acid transport system permease protein
MSGISENRNGREQEPGDRRFRELKPPVLETGVLGWMRKNLFSTWYNIILTLLSAWFLLTVLPGLLGWAFLDARWSVVTENITNLLIGRYPRDQVWRIAVSVALLLALGAVTYLSGREERRKVRRAILISWILSLPLINILLRGFSPENALLPFVNPELWSGLMLTLVLSVVGIAASFPLAILLALGRQSSLVTIRLASTAYIETIRGVPLITILFMSQVILPLFLPGEVRIETVTRALIGMTLFSAAYTAENIRGGLASIPAGQYEAARALGLNNFYVTVLIILPQALRAVIPPIVGQFIALFKDTTLVAIVGLFDILGIAKSITSQREFIGHHMESYSFVALCFFIFCYALSYASRRLEKSLGVGVR